jgi:hypothetical protein
VPFIRDLWESLAIGDAKIVAFMIKLFILPVFIDRVYRAIAKKEKIFVRPVKSMERVHFCKIEFFIFHHGGNLSILKLHHSGLLQVLLDDRINDARDH